MLVSLRDMTYIDKGFYKVFLSSVTDIDDETSYRLGSDKACVTVTDIDIITDD